MNVVVLNNVLDTAAFLLVTIDLYGRERLEKLTTRLRSYRVSGGTLKALRSYLSQSNTGKSTGIFMIIKLKQSVFISIFMEFVELGVNEKEVLSIHFMRFVFILICVFLVLMIPYIFGFGFLFMLLTFQVIFENIMSVSKRLGADGLFLVVGTAIFMLSRAIAIIDAVR